MGSGVKSGQTRHISVNLSPEWRRLHSRIFSSHQRLNWIEEITIHPIMLKSDRHTRARQHLPGNSICAGIRTKTQLSQFTFPHQLKEMSVWQHLSLGCLFMSLLDGATFSRDTLVFVEQWSWTCGLLSMEKEIWQIFFLPNICFSELLLPAVVCLIDSSQGINQQPLQRSQT